MTYAFYICPNCKRQSKEMKLLKNSKYNPMDEKRNMHKFPITHHEILRCKCGILLTWYDMEEIEPGTIQA